MAVLRKQSNIFAVLLSLQTGEDFDLEMNDTK